MEFKPFYNRVKDSDWVMFLKDAESTFQASGRTARLVQRVY